MFLKNRRIKRINDYKDKLIQNHYSHEKISELEKIYKLVIRLSNIFWITILMHVILFTSLLISFIWKHDLTADFKKYTNLVFIQISAIHSLISIIFTIILTIRIIKSNLYEIRKKAIKPWAISTLVLTIIIPIPIFAKITLFVAKIRIKYIYM